MVVVVTDHSRVRNPTSVGGGTTQECTGQELRTCTFLSLETTDKKKNIHVVGIVLFQVGHTGVNWK